MTVRFIAGVFLACTLLFGLSACEGVSVSSRVSTVAVPLEIPPDVQNEGSTGQSPRDVDYIVVQKKDRILSIWKDGRLLKAYPILALGANPVGQKVYEGDERTPEGQYYISEMHVSQNFQKFLEISYPNDHDRKIAQRFGMSPGGHVGIHGDRGGVSGFFQRFDKSWTDGCLALRNDDVEDLYGKVVVGTPIILKP